MTKLKELILFIEGHECAGNFISAILSWICCQVSTVLSWADHYLCWQVSAQSTCTRLPKASYVDAGWLAGCFHLWSLFAVAYYYVVHLAEFSKGGASSCQTSCRLHSPPQDADHPPIMCDQIALFVILGHFLGIVGREGSDVFAGSPLTQ
jgi:hypothetical protein